MQPEESGTTRAALHYADSIVDTMREAMVVLRMDLRIKSVNRAFCEIFKCLKADVEGRMLFEIGNRQWDINSLRVLLTEIIPRQAVFNDFEVSHDFPEIGRKSMLLNARRLNSSQLILLAIEDVTEKRRLAEESREMETRFTSLVKNIRDHSIFTMDVNGTITSWNMEAERIIGYSEDEAIGKNWLMSCGTRWPLSCHVQNS
jgi:PAS domain S-box-containing protein